MIELTEEQLAWARAVAIEFVGYDVVALHWIDKPHVIQKGGYVQITSLEAFKARQLKQFEPAVIAKRRQIAPAGRWFRVVQEREFLLERAATKESMEHVTGRPYVERTETVVQHKHASVWAFYQAVGWDYHLKKFILVRP